MSIASFAADYPQYGRDHSRNMVSPEKGLPFAAEVGKPKEGASGEIDPATTKNIKWSVRLGTQSYGNPTVAGGRVLVGTNNGNPRDSKYQGDYGILMCFDESTGKFLWQLAAPKLAAGRENDYPDVGICSSPTIDGDRVYVVTNRCEVVCLDLAGLANGNDGPFKEEAQYTAGPRQPPIPQGPADADIIWRFDMRDELGVFPRYTASGSVLVVGDRLYINTSNGVDWSGKHVPAPWAPVLICLDKKTGKLLGEDKSGISPKTFYCNWSSPAYGAVNGKPTIAIGGGDGWCYGFDPEPAGGVLKELWRLDCNPPERRVKDGKPIKYRDPKGPSEIMATPVIHDGRVYVAVGQDPEHGEVEGCLTCIDASKPEAAWRFATMKRSMSTVAVADGLLYIPDMTGMVYCLDAASGKQVWTHDTEGAIWGSTLVADGKVYVGNESGDLTVLTAGREKKMLGKIDMGQPIYSTPIAANGVLYVMTGQNLLAIAEAKKK
jgi:outer membrane protein assembly factor BamB